MGKQILGLTLVDKLYIGWFRIASNKGCGSKSVYLQILAVLWKYTDLLRHPLNKLTLNLVSMICKKLTWTFQFTPSLYISESMLLSIINLDVLKFLVFPSVPTIFQETKPPETTECSTYCCNYWKKSKYQEKKWWKRMRWV